MSSRDPDLVQRDEEREVEAMARRRHYSRSLSARDDRTMKLMSRILRVGVPAVYVAFVVVYFLVGLSFYRAGNEE